MKLIDIAKILRSKNAGPLFITFDLMFSKNEDMKKVAENLTKEMVAEAYGISAAEVTIIVYDVVDSIKITFPRKHISGSVFDDDVYGCQQHTPLANIEI